MQSAVRLRQAAAAEADQGAGREAAVPRNAALRDAGREGGGFAAVLPRVRNVSRGPLR
jgi:hypothetical protein